MYGACFGVLFELLLGGPTYVGLDRDHLQSLPTLLTTLTTSSSLYYSSPLYFLTNPTVHSQRLFVQTVHRCRTILVWYVVISPYLPFASHAKTTVQLVDTQPPGSLLRHLDNGPNSPSHQHRCSTPRSCCSTDKIGWSLKRNRPHSPFSASLEWRAPAQWIHGIHDFFNLRRVPLPLLRVRIVLVSPFTRVEHGIIIAAYPPVYLQLTQPFGR